MGAATSTAASAAATAFSAASEAFAPDAEVLSKFILCPDPGPGGFTSTYDSAPSVDAGFGSVNAGNGRSMRLGGSGLNGQFAKDLQAAGLPTGDFQRLHQDLLSQACDEPQRLVKAKRCPRGVLAAFARVADTDGGGFVAIDIFEEDARPLHRANVAMLYCIGPDRREAASDGAFLAQLSSLGASLASACRAYAARAAGEALPPLRRVRVALVSGGKYAGKVSADAVALHLLRGLAHRGAADSRGEGPVAQEDDPVFELAFADAAFGRALARLRAEAQPPRGSEEASSSTPPLVAAGGGEAAAAPLAPSAAAAGGEAAAVLSSGEVVAQPMTNGYH